MKRTWSIITVSKRSTSQSIQSVAQAQRILTQTTCRYPNIAVGSHVLRTCIHRARSPSSSVSGKQCRLLWWVVYSCISLPALSREWATSTISLSAPPIPKSGWMMAIILWNEYSVDVCLDTASPDGSASVSSLRLLRLIFCCSSGVPTPLILSTIVSY